MCRRFQTDTASATSSGPQRKSSTGWRKVNKSHMKHLRRRNSLDALSSSRDLKERRPSEEALNISGEFLKFITNAYSVLLMHYF